MSKHFPQNIISPFRENTCIICVPMVGANDVLLLSEAEAANKSDADIVEWRIDALRGFDNVDDILALAQHLRAKIHQPLIATVRSVPEGGLGGLAQNLGIEILLAMVARGLTDFVDAEIDGDATAFRQIQETADANNVPVIASKHYTTSTPSVAAMEERLMQAYKMGHIPKLAVMAQNMADVARLLEATAMVRQQVVDRPLITMAMGQFGRVSRVVGEVFGSSLTFAQLGSASAPGQMPLDIVRGLITELRGSGL